MSRDHAGSLGARRRRAVGAAALLAVASVLARPAQADTAHVTARGTAFVPAMVSVRQTAGEPASPAAHGHVVWTNEDPGIEHTVTFDDPRLVSSGRIGTGQRYEAVISVTGSFPYRCTIHPAMTGNVVVTAAVPTSTGGAPAAADSDGSGGSTPVLVAGGAAVAAALAALAWFLARRRRPAADEPAAR